jgi:hypothetical protein
MLHTIARGALAANHFAASGSIVHTDAMPDAGCAGLAALVYAALAVAGDVRKRGRQKKEACHSREPRESRGWAGAFRLTATGRRAQLVAGRAAWITACAGMTSPGPCGYDAANPRGPNV